MTLEPKQFYRRLETLIQQIDAGSGSTQWFEWLMKEILERFGEELSVSSARLYCEEAEGFRLERQLSGPEPGVEGILIPPSYPPLADVVEHGLGVLNSATLGFDESLEGRLGGRESVALYIHSEPRRLLAFGLAAGWQPERTELAMHTIRSAINSRLRTVDLHLDLDQLVELQRALIPDEPPTMPGFSFACRCNPYAPIGGDFYDFQALNDGAIGLALGDASGHGLPAALVARDIVTGLRMATTSQLKIATTMDRLNSVIAQSSLSSRFVSLFFGELEDNGNFFYVNAGHQPGILVSPSGTQLLRIGGCVLGPIEDAIFKRGFSHIDRGATLVLLTDGVLERKSPSGQLFGLAGVETVVKEHLGATADVVLEAILAATEEHAQGLLATDDTSLVVVSRSAKGRSRREASRRRTAQF